MGPAFRLKLLKVSSDSDNDIELSILCLTGWDDVITAIH